MMPSQLPHHSRLYALSFPDWALGGSRPTPVVYIEKQEEEVAAGADATGRCVNSCGWRLSSGTMASSLRYTLLVSCILCAAHISFMENAVIPGKQTEWRKLILTHHWPVTVCKMAKEKCEGLPPYWTLHGLWPDKSQACNHSWPFNKDEIQDLLTDMNKWWPDLLHPNQSELWKHEWQKHGTCAASLAALNSQHKYFSKGLDLYSAMAINSALEKSRITPAQTYKKDEIESAFLSLYGVLPKIQCLPPEQDGETQTLGQIEICLTKDFNLQNCTEQPHEGRAVTTAYEDLHVCDKDIGIYYPPAQ